MNFIRTFSRSLKRVVLGSDDDDDDSDGGFATRSRRRGRAKSRTSTPVVESAVSELSGIAHGGVQGLNWVAANEKVDDDGDVADGFLVCEDDGDGDGTAKTKTTGRATSTKGGKKTRVKRGK